MDFRDMTVSARGQEPEAISFARSGHPCIDLLAYPDSAPEASPDSAPEEAKMAYPVGMADEQVSDLEIEEYKDAGVS